MSVAPAGYSAYLRVYEPVAAFPAAERARWAAYVSAGAAPDRATGAALEHRAAMQALLVGRAVPDGPEHAFAIRSEGALHVCPMSTRVRAWGALTEFRRGLPPPVADSFVAPAVAAAAETAAAGWRMQHPEQRLHVESSTWQVPLRWFLLFEPDERRLMLGAPAAGGPRTGVGRTLLYLTAMSRARRRLARALAVLRRTLGDGSVVTAVEDLGRWLEEFHPHAMVELDYGGLVHLLDDEALRSDTSVADVARSLTHLGAGEQQEAAAAYEAVIERWRAVAGLENAN